MATTNMFRAQALKRVSSPEQLDRVVRAALPLQWVALLALLAVVATVVAWSAIATVPTTLPGSGTYVPVGGLRLAETMSSGTITNEPGLRVGADVTAGEVLAAVAAPAPGGPTATSVVDVTAPTKGTLVEVNDVSGTYVHAGESIAVVEPTGKPLVIYSYIPNEEASALIRGVPVQVTFGAGVGATFGYAKGVVASVSRYPVSPEQVHAVLGNSSLTDKILAAGPSKEVVIAMVPSRDTKSGLTWATGQGPPGRLPPGLPASVRFVIGSHHPISDVL